MNIREPILSPGWYPRNPEEINEFLLPFRSFFPGNCPAAIVPHAGWYFSGRIAARAISKLQNAETVVIIGGHNPQSFLFAEEEGVRTPFGIMEIDDELRVLLKKQLNGRADKYPDNTVEVLLPMVHSFFPKARLLWLRFPGNLSSFEAGKAIAIAAETLNRSIVVLGSTDLTHYGDSYGFTPMGNGEAALDWVRNTNDAAFINAVLDGKPTEVLRRADEEYSSCSPGAVLGVLGYLNQQRVKNPVLLEYATSADISGRNTGSFVGYAAISWEKKAS